MRRKRGENGLTGALVVALIVMLSAMVAGSPAGVLAGEDVGSSSQESFREAVGALPLERLAPDDAQEVRACLEKTSLYRRLPAQIFDCDRSLLMFSLDHPEAIVDIWRTLDISRLSLDPTGPAAWRLADGYGTVGSVRLLASQPVNGGGRRLFLCEGGYTGVLAAKPLTGKCLVLLRHRELTSTGGGSSSRHVVTIDAFLQVDGKGLEIAARTLQSLIVRCAAWNAREICLFLSELSDTCGENPAGVALLARRLVRTDPRQRETLATIATGIASRSTVPTGTDVERLRVELAARWLQPEAIQDLEATKRN